MKKHQNKGVNLRKITIARIDAKSMIKINGGDCVVGEDDTGSHHSFCACDPGQTVF